ncbi:MAG: hypothetical protein A3J76_03750 [Candidatus Moranbacteria bacterium RBG_13_45_13]|nr:MAG: hypothetical protein A3J76_03750 [Candidatus Moranbacteria bacterium RBG_13_45_13]
MLEKLKKHGVKILVFLINILLAAVAVFVIREKDQARLLEKAQEEKNLESENAKKDPLPSFENSVSVESQQGTSGAESNSSPEDPANQIPPDGSAAVAPVVPPPANPAPMIPIPFATQNTKPADRKTKTS